MDKMLRFFVLFVLSFLTTLTSYAQTYKVDGIYYKLINVKDSTKVLVAKVPADGTAYAGDIVLADSVDIPFPGKKEEDPKTVKRCAVTKIDNDAFQNAAITSIILPKSITQIGANAFRGCSQLTKVTYASLEHVLSIDYLNINKNEYSREANPMCRTKGFFIAGEEKEVTNLVIPDALVTAIKPYAFTNCERLDSVYISHTVKAIGTGAFNGCTNLKKVRVKDFDSYCHISFADRTANPLLYAHHLYIGDRELTIIENIPADLEGISAAAFAGGQEITKVTIPANIQRIGVDAFYGCNGILVVDYPSVESTTSIDYGNIYSNPMRNVEILMVNGSNITEVSIDDDVKSSAYYGCKWLTKVTLGANVQRIGASAFRECTKLETVVMNTLNLITIDNDAFNTCTKLKSIKLPESLDTIGIGAFRGCAQLDTLVIPENTVNIYKESFMSCSRLKEVTIKSPITTIPESMFQSCTGLVKVNLQPTVQTILKNAFAGCSSLEDLPQGCELTFIDEQAFMGCGSFSLLNLPSTLTYIGRRAFYNCKKLTDLIIQNNPANDINNAAAALSISTEAFYQDDPYYGDPYKLENIYSYAVVAPNATETTFRAPGDINLFTPEEAIGYGEMPWKLFKSPVTISKKQISYIINDTDTFKIDSVQVGKSIPMAETPTMNKWEFSGWLESMPSVMPDNDLTFHGYFSINQRIDSLRYYIRYDKREATVINDKDYRDYNSISIPERIVFADSIVIPDTVIHLDSIFVVRYIGDRAFNDSCKIQSFTLSDSIRGIGKAAFANCINLSSFTFPKHITVLEDSLFFGCKELIDLHNIKNVTKIGASAFNKCSSLNLQSLPDSLTTIGELAFCGTGLAEINIPKKVTKMGNRVFLSCSSLSSVKFNDGSTMTQLPANTFQDCYSLNQVDFPSSMTVIGSSAFQNCKAIKELKVPEGIKTIMSNAYFGCSNLEKISLPSTVETIGDKAFLSCNKVKEVVVNRDTPPSATNNLFQKDNDINVYDIANLYVTKPDLYKERYPWKYFKSIASRERKRLTYLVDSKVFRIDSIFVGEDIDPIEREELGHGDRIFSGWRNLPKQMPGNDVVATGVFKYERAYIDKAKGDTLYKDTLFYGEKITLPDTLEIKNQECVVEPDLETMPAQDTALFVTYYVSEVELAYNGLLYYIYTRIEEPHAELMQGRYGRNDIDYNEHIITVPDSVEYLDKRYAVKVIRPRAFQNSQVRTLTLPSVVDSIGEQALSRCRYMTTIKIPASVSRIGEGLLYSCQNLTSVTFEGDKFTSLPADIFRDCRKLATIQLPAKITTIGSQAFSGCKALTEISFPEKVESIGSAAFMDCDNLLTIRVNSKTMYPTASEDVFDDKCYDDATLFAPEALLNNIPDPWSRFTVQIDDPNVDSCQVPKIQYIKGKLLFTCETTGATIKTDIRVDDAVQNYKKNDLDFTQTYIITAYATSPLNKPSKEAVATITWRNGKPVMTGFDKVELQDGPIKGDMNNDGKISAQDASLILQIVAGKITDEDNNQE